jgi:type IV pilus assembly protein PilE
MKCELIKGLTLIELLVCLAIVGILATLAYPRYINHLTLARRTQAQQNLLILAKNMAQYRYEHKNYLDANLSKLTTQTIRNDTHYHYEIQELTTDSYQLAAQPTAQQAQNDKGCGTLTLNQLGEQNITGNRSVFECWLV